MIVGDLTRDDLVTRLGSSGLAIRTGPFRCCIRSDLAQIAEGISSLYADFQIVPSGEFADFDVSVLKLQGLRRWLFPRAYFLLRGDQFPVLGRFPAPLALTFLEWGMNYAIYRQLYSSLILHAAVLERDGRAVVIMGDSGAGKSTLCAALTLSGWRLLTDELGLIDLNDGLVAPLVRPISLKNESINVIRRLSSNAEVGPICRTKRKGDVAHLRPPTDSVRQMDVRAVPHWLVFVRFCSGAPLQVEEIPRAQAFPELSRGTFNYHGLGETGFRVLCRLLDQVVCQRLSYGQLDDAIAHFNSPRYGASHSAAG